MKNKLGQMTIFVIVALVAVVLVFLFFLLRSQIGESSTISSASDSPNQYLAECISEYIDEASRIILQNNGYISKSDYKNSMEYEYIEIPYLCYTDGFYERCETQETALTSHINEEIYNYIDEKIDECFDSFEADLESDGFSVTAEPGKTFTVELIPRKINVEITKNIKFEKAESAKTFSGVVVSSVSPLYDMAQVVKRIVQEEALWANSEYIEIMRANSWVEIDKTTLGDDNEIYDVTDTKTGSTWRFAIRGGVLSTPS